MNTQKTVEQILKQIKDEQLQLTAEELGLSYKLRENGQRLALDFQAGFPAKSLEKSYLPLLRHALREALPDMDIDLHIDSFIKAHQTQLPGMALRGVKNTIAIASGKGGVGKSTVTVNLACSLARQGAKVGILDADIYGPSIPLMLGETKPVDIKDERYYLPVKAHGLDAMSIGYLTDNEQALIWRGPMLAKSLLQMLDITLWDELDYLFIDLPPGTGDIQLSLVQKIPLTAAIVVTTPQNVATLDAQKAIAMFNKTNIHVLGVIENMALHHCSQCGHEEAIFGEGGAEALCESKATKLLGSLPLDGQIRKNADEGLPTAAQSEHPLTPTFDKTALNAAIALSQRPVNYAGKFPKIVVE